MIDFAGKRWWYLTISAVIVLIMAAALAIWRLEPGIEFTSGSSFTFRFTEQSVDQDQLRDAMGELGHPEARVQGAGENTFLIRTDELEGAPAPTDPDVIGPTAPVVGELEQIEAGLRERFGALTREDFSTVSGTVSSEIALYSFWATVAACVAILVYIWIAFRKVPNSFRYGTAAIVAVVHDALIILGVFAILGEFRGTEVDTAFITALLTVIGYSTHDTIVVFDRLREKLHSDPYIPFEEAVNASMMETLSRSLNTALTVVFTVVAMLLIGGDTIRDFLLVLLVGVVAGMYSSIAIASQFLVAWEKHDVSRFFRRLRGGESKAAPEAV